jgi:hypothetical protein
MAPRVMAKCLALAILLGCAHPIWADSRPNLVYILTDDTDVLLGSEYSAFPSCAQTVSVGCRCSHNEANSGTDRGCWNNLHPCVDVESKMHAESHRPTRRCARRCWARASQQVRMTAAPWS